MGRRAPLSGEEGLCRALRAELHGHRRQDHPPRKGGGRDVEGARRPLHRGILQGDRRAQRAPRRRLSARFGAYCGRARRDRKAHREGLCLCARRRRLLQRGALRGLRQAQRPLLGRHAGGRTRRRRRAQASSDGFRAVEGGEARRAILGQSVGQGASGLAHRVFNDVDEVSGRDVRLPRRRQRSHLPASRERDRTGAGMHGRRPQLRSLLAAQRLHHDP